MATPKILVLDVETAPILARVWGLYDQTVSLGQIKQDWFILSWAAKWLDSKQIVYRDVRRVFRKQNDKTILGHLWKLLDQADIVLAQNGKQFDIKKINARFIQNGFKPPSPYKVVDTLLIARRIFGFTSNKLAYMTDKLNTKYKKLEHKKFPGMELWVECLKGNQSAWKEMEKYNKWDVLSLEELYKNLLPWDSSLNFDVYSPGRPKTCPCGNMSFQSRGYYYTAASRFQCYRCTKCGKQSRAAKNELSQKDQQKMGRGFK